MREPAHPGAPPAGGEPPRVRETGIAGTVVLALAPEADERGSLTELCRFSWIDPVQLPQWNLVRSRAGVLRGMHFHNRHHDLISVVAGGSCWRCRICGPARRPAASRGCSRSTPSPLRRC